MAQTLTYSPEVAAATHSTYQLVKDVIPEIEMAGAWRPTSRSSTN